MGGRLLANPKAAWIVCGVALVAGGITVTLPTVLALSRPLEKPAVALYVSPGNKVVLESHAARSSTIDYAVATRYGKRSIARGSLVATPDQQVAVPLPSVPCATPVTVKAEEMDPYRYRSVSLTIMPEPGGKAQCGG